MNVATCGACICRTCLLWWSSRCPYGDCWDDHRAQVDPYDKAHPGAPPRTAWSDWRTEQAYWCRGGAFYPIEQCPHYVEYTADATRVENCLVAPVVVYQDGFIRCYMVDRIGCEECYKRWEERCEAK